MEQHPNDCGLIVFLAFVCLLVAALIAWSNVQHDRGMSVPTGHPVSHDDSPPREGRVTQDGDVYVLISAE